MADGRDEIKALSAAAEAWAQEAFETKRFAAQLAVERQALADQLATVEARLQAQADRAVDAARQERDRAFEARDAAVQARDQAAAAQQEAEAALARVTGSTVWRATAPLRAAMMIVLGRPRGGR